MQLTERELGKWGEKKAAHFLKKRGYRIIKRNYYTRRGEIDLVTRRHDLLAFVEVKTRRSLKFGPPRAAVDKYKQQKIKQAARYFLVQQQKQHLQFRFDVIAIIITGGRGKLYHLKNAF